MKIYVDELPYYGEYCPFKDTCWQSETDDCPDIGINIKFVAMKIHTNV